MYTKDELVRIFKVKMSKLQLLYKKQMQMLTHQMCDEKDKYKTMKKSEEDLGSASKLPNRNSKTLRAARKYRSHSKKVK